MLITLLLIERKLLPTPLLYLSAFFEATRNEYYRQLYEVSSNGSWQEWFIYFLDGVAIQGLDVLSRAERINALLISWEGKLTSRSDRIARDIIKLLTVTPFCTTKHISEKCGIAFTTAQRAINKLEKLRILTQITQAQRDKVYCANDILTILEEPTKTHEDTNGSLR